MRRPVLARVLKPLAEPGCSGHSASERAQRAGRVARSVAGHSFYFRERKGDWRIELDLQPSGRFVSTWRGGDFDDEGSFESRELDEGDVIARGVVEVPGYGGSPVERAEFIVGTIRDHLTRSPARCIATTWSASKSPRPATGVRL